MVLEVSFTGINMIDFYRELIESEGCDVEFVFSNDVKTILDYKRGRFDL